MTANHVLGLRVVLGDGTVAHARRRQPRTGRPGSRGPVRRIRRAVRHRAGDHAAAGGAARPYIARCWRRTTTLQAAGDAVSRDHRVGPAARRDGDHGPAGHRRRRSRRAGGLSGGRRGRPDRRARRRARAKWPRSSTRLMRDSSRRPGATHTHVAADEDERARIWKGRKCAFSAVGRLSPDFIVQDGVVPRARLGEALATIEALSREHGIRVANVFHAGDGNLHPLILYDGREAGAHDRAEVLAAEILRLCIRLGGSITGEHGVGLEKRAVPRRDVRRGRSRLHAADAPGDGPAPASPTPARSSCVRRRRRLAWPAPARARRRRSHAHDPAVRRPSSDLAGTPSRATAASDVRGGGTSQPCRAPPPERPHSI